MSLLRWNISDESFCQRNTMGINFNTRYIRHTKKVHTYSVLKGTCTNLTICINKDRDRIGQLYDGLVIIFSFQSKKWYSLHSGGMVLISSYYIIGPIFCWPLIRKQIFLKKVVLLSHNPSNIRQTKRIGTVRLQRTQAVSSLSYPLSLINKVQKYQQLQFGQVFTREKKADWVSVSEPFLSSYSTTA